MKRIVSLVLVVAMALSLLTGNAAAEMAVLTMNCPSVAPMPGSRGFHLCLDGVVVEDSRVSDIQLVGDGLGTVFYNGDREWFTWDTNTACPGRTGKLRAVIDGVTYEMDVSTTDTPMVAFYRGTECTEENYLPILADHRFLYGEDTLPVITLKVNEPDWTIDAASYDRAGIMNVSISEDGKTATYTLKETVTGTQETRLLPVINGEQWMLRTVIVVPEGVSTSMSLTDTPIPGGFQFDFLKDGEVVSSNDVTDIHFSDENLGFVLYVQDEINNGAGLDLRYGQFMWDTNNARPLQSGTLFATIDGIEYSLPVSTGAARWGYYTDESCSVDSYLMRSQNHRLNYTQENGLTIWFRLNDGETVAETNTSNNQIMTAAALPETPSNMTSFTLNEGVSGTYEVELVVMTNTGVKRNIWITVSNDVFTSTDAFPMTEEYMFLLEPGGLASPVSFELDGNIYYLAVTLPDAHAPFDMESMNPPLVEGDLHDVTFQITFWTSMGDGNFARVTDMETLNQIRVAFDGSLELKLYGAKGFVGKSPVVYPALTTSSNWMCLTSMHLGADNDGDYVFVATGTVGGQSVRCVKQYQWAPTVQKYWTPTVDLDSGKDAITVINEYLDAYEPEEGVNLRINIPEGTYSGQIVIPAFEFQGNHGLEFTGVGEVVLNGGISNNFGFYVNFSNITFQGAGKNAKITAEGSPNQACYGSSPVTVQDCVFRDYYIALNCSGGNSAPSNNSFYNNHIALYYDNDAHGGNPNLRRNRFAGNDIALDFEHISKDLPTTFYNIRDNRFIDNKWDVRNKLKRTLYLPGNFFGETVGEDVVARPCNAQVKHGSTVTSLMDETLDEDNLEYAEQIHAYPRYADNSFSAWEKESEAVVSVAQTADFRIPQANLSGSAITVMDAEEELATLVFPDSGSGVSLFSENDGTFDATVSVKENEDGSVTFTMNDPLGLTPTVRIPCARGGVKVTDPDGKNLEVREENGCCCFEAPIGGNYTIRSAMAAELDASGMLRVELEITEELVEKGVEQAVLAIYNQAGQLVALALHDDLENPLEFTTEKYDLTQCDVKVMLLSDDSAPLCGAAFLKAAKSE